MQKISTKFLLLVIITVVTAIIALTPATFAATLNTADWYQYNGTGAGHSFSLRFPTDWQSYTLGDDLQGFGPKSGSSEAPLFLVQEFSGKTYEQAIDYYAGETSSADFIFRSTKEDLTAKQVASKTFIKRGSLIVALRRESASSQYADVLNAIHDSFKFTDNWHQYINLADHYSFIFPVDFKIENLDSGVSVVTDTITATPIFSVLKYENSNTDATIDSVENLGYSFVSSEEINFHGLIAQQVIYEDNAYDKELSKIVIEKDGDSFVLSDINVEENFPVPNYYNEYIAEMLESFEFFELDYENFPDVKNTHPNGTAINSLVEDAVINGYPDGTFKPDGLINRAELTKMIVASKITPDPNQFKNCFPDIKEEWFAPYICYAKAQGWVEGYSDSNFKPANNINRVEALKIILNVIFEEIPQSHLDPAGPPADEPPALDIDLTEWYARYFTFADIGDLLDKQHIEVSGDSYFYFPSDPMTRKEVAETIYRALRK